LSKAPFKFIFIFKGKKKKLGLHDRLEIVQRFVCFFIIQIVATTDTAMAATIAPTKMPARALFFKPDDTIFGNSAKKEKKRGGHIDLRFFYQKHQTYT
jgi:hypothetical protein